MLTLNDGRNELWQWDTGRTLTVDADCTQVHFSNKVFGRSIDMNVVDGIAIIPDILLQTDKDLIAWAFVGTAENGYTKISKVFKVNKRNKPADYVFTPPEQTTLAEIMERIYDLEAIQDPDAIKNAVDDYLVNNPIQIDETDPTVPAWAKQATKPKYTAAEVGAVATVNGVKPDANGNVEITIQDSGGNVDYVGVEPAEDDMPKVFFGGALQQTKDEKVVPFRYISKTDDFSGYAEIKAQGNSSMNYPKKNQTVKMFADEACDSKMKKDFKGWGKQNKHVYKANWIDLTHARNVVSARLWADVVKSRANYAELPELLRTSPNQGAVDGFPVKVYADGVYQGRYTLNIPKDKWTFNMDDELDEHCVLCGENYYSGCFRAAAKIDESDWTDEIHDVVPASIKTRWNQVISFVMNSTDEEFKANLSQYFYVDSLIDYYLFGLASCGLDAFGKNQIYATYDGQKWIASMYDMDSTWGLYWNGSKFVASDYARTSYEDYVSTSASGEGNLLYNRLEQLFSAELQTRWEELKNGAMSIENIINRFERFTDIAPAELVKEDYASTTGGGKFTGIPSQTTNNIQQIRSFALARQAWTDEYISGLSGEEPEEPEEPEATLTSISATYSGGDVTEGTAVTDLTGIVVTAHYSDGTSKAVTGYTLSGTIAEGSNTITVSYGGKTTTFTVIGTAEDELVYQLPSATTFDGTNYIDTGVQLFATNKPFTVCLDWIHTGESAFVNDTYVIAHCMHEANPWPGVCVQYDNTSIACQIIQGTKIEQKLLQNEVQTHSRIRAVFVKDEYGDCFVCCRIDENDIKETSRKQLSYVKITQSLLLGCYQTAGGEKGRYAKGILSDCKVYNYALSDSEINAFLTAN